MTDAVMDDASFDINLNEIDPTFKAIDEGVYTLKVIRLLKKKGPKQSYVSGRFAVQGDQKYSGRNIFQNLFPSNSYDQKSLRRIADATGIHQTGSFEEWLAQVSQVQPAIKVPVLKRQATEKAVAVDGSTTRVGKVDLDGNPVLENVIDFKEVGIA